MMCTAKGVAGALCFLELVGRARWHYCEVLRTILGMEETLV